MKIHKYIDLEEAIKAVCRSECGCTTPCYDNPCDILSDMISKAESERLPSADAAEVIRCRDCKHRRENCGMGDHRWCDFHRMTTRADDFCSYGRRKNDGSCK